MNSQKIEIDTQYKGYVKRIHAVQGDSGRTIECSLTDMALQSSYKAILYAVKPSGAKIYNACTVGECVEIELTEQILAESGVVACQVEIRDSFEARVTAFVFDLNVVEKIDASEEVVSTNEFTVLQDALSEVDSIAPAISSMNSQVDAKIKEMEAPLFTQATERVNIYSGETFGVLFGKISKWFGDLRSAAFADVKNNVATEDEGGVLDARMGKYLNDRIDAVSSSVKMYSSVVSFNGGYATIPISYSGEAPVVMAQLANAGSIVITSCSIVSGNISIRCMNYDGSTYSGNQTVSILINAY